MTSCSRVPVCLAVAILGAFAVQDVSLAAELFNGVDLDGWTYSAQPWIVEDGVLRNTGPGNDSDYLVYDTLLTSDPFMFEMRLRVMDCTNTYPRPRIKLGPPEHHHQIYFGNEGFTRQFEIYGSGLSGVTQVGNDSYNLRTWYTLRLEIDEYDNVLFYKNNLLTHTARRTTRSPMKIGIWAGDGWSQGHLQISSITYVPEPATLALLAVGGLALIRRARCKRR